MHEQCVKELNVPNSVVTLKVGDTRYAVAYTVNTRVIEVEILQIKVFSDVNMPAEIAVRNVDDRADIWFLNLDSFLEWADFSTREEAEDALKAYNTKNT